MFKRLTIFLYGVACYALFFGTFLYAIGFIGNFAVPRTLDSAPAGSFLASLLVDLLLLGAFAIQLEERDLVDVHPEYRVYRQQVPMIVPFTRKRFEDPALIRR